MIDGIDEISPSEAATRQARGALLIDVREDDERAGGMPVGAIGVPLAEVAARIADIEARYERDILTICASGKRSLRAAQTLRELGYTNLASVAGGFLRWNAEGLPLADGGLGADALERYSRHLLLPEVGAVGQGRLSQARIALVGAGGLGSPAAFYLAAAGVGHLTLIDDDVVIDGADNFPTRYLLSAACRQLQIPLVYGAVHRFTGQVSVFDSRDAASPCYRCLFPEPPAAEDAPNCAEAGVLGVLPGTIGLLQATEAIKLVLGIGAPLTGRLLCYDALAATFRELRLPRDPQCPGCGEHAVFHGYEDVAQICASA